MRQDVASQKCTGGRAMELEAEPPNVVVGDRAPAPKNLQYCDSAEGRSSVD